jgi:hypothetical protein
VKREAATTTASATQPLVCVPAFLALGAPPAPPCSRWCASPLWCARWGPVGPCVRAKGLRACAHLNGLPVCAASSADALARDAMVGRALEKHFWTWPPGCMADMSVFLCPHNLPVCAQDSTVAKVCLDVRTTAYASCGLAPIGDPWLVVPWQPPTSPLCLPPRCPSPPVRRQPPHRHWLLCAGGQR